LSDIYAIGDVQGCFDSLQALLAALPIKGKDKIWLCGDLVNRGPKSAEVLRWCMEEGKRVKVVLGNHDLHLLSAAAGTREIKSKDTFGDVLAAVDRDELLGWLRRQPLAHLEGDHLMVHAGLHPTWSLALAMKLASECESAIQSDNWHSAWKLSRPDPPGWSDELQGKERLAAALSVLVGIRTLYADGRLNTAYAGPPKDAPDGSHPWFSSSNCDATVVFGHWAALGLYVGTSHLGLDTGCVWGNKLTAIRLRDRAVFHQPALEDRRAIP
jgi:bis(5'-nucleosyl)-tetraphosphatase (symmetrical)